MTRDNRSYRAHATRIESAVRNCRSAVALRAWIFLSVNGRAMHESLLQSRLHVGRGGWQRALKCGFESGLLTRSESGYIRAVGVDEPPGDHDAVQDLKARGAVQDLKARGAVQDLKARGAVQDLKARGAVQDLKARGAVQDLKARGAVQDLKARGSVQDLKARGVDEPPGDKATRSESGYPHSGGERGDKATRSESQVRTSDSDRVGFGADLSKITDPSLSDINSFPSTQATREHDAVQDLKACGVYERIAVRLVETYGVEYVQGYIRSLPVFRSKYGLERPGGFLVKAIENAYPIPEAEPHFDISLVGVRRSNWE